MAVSVDYARELKSRLIERPCCALELVQALSREFNLDIEDVKLHVLLELRKMIDSGFIEVKNVNHHDMFIVQYSPQ